MHIVDVLVLIVLLYGLYRGVVKGFFVALASLLSFLIGLICALKFSNSLKTVLFERLNWDSRAIAVIAFVLIFIVAVVLVRLIGKWATEAFKALSLGIIVRVLGGVFEVVRMAIVVALMFALFDMVNIDYSLVSKEILQDSYSYPMYQWVSLHLFPRMFASFFELFATARETLEL